MNVSINKLAQVSGFIYILIAFAGGFAFFTAFEGLLVLDNIHQSIQNIKESEFLFRLGIVGDSFVFILEIVLTTFLYQLFKPVNKIMSQVAAISRYIMTALIGINVLNKLLVIELITTPSYLSTFTELQIEGLAFLFLNAYSYVTLIWGIFFALHLIIMSRLICHSNLFPKVFAALFFFAGLAYVVNSLGLILLPQYSDIFNIIIMFSIPAELSFALWLLIKGVNEKQWSELPT